MKLTTPEISWHGKEPVLSVDFCKIGNTMRLASAGADNDVKMWLVSFKADGNAKTEFLSNLSRHNKAVNVVRFAPNEELLASASDDGVIILWKLNLAQEQCVQTLKDKDDDVENRESWSAHKVLRGHIEDVYDLAWSPDGSQLISGSVDNSAIVWDVVKGVKLQILKDHKHYVQGVCWDPLGQYVVTNSSDRSCRIYCSQTYRCCYNINKLSGSAKLKIPEGGELKQLKMFHDETMLSFFRRPTFTPDGSLLIVPAGRIDKPSKAMNATFVFTRGSPNKPVLYLPSPKKPTVAVRCCPLLFELKKKDEEMEKENEQEQETSSLFKLPYRMVFAVATLNSVLLYDTQHKIPFGYISNIHYSGISDVTWSNDGRFLVVSSTDGYCSMVQFDENELGTPYEKTIKDVLENPNEFHNLNNSNIPSTPAEIPDATGKVQKGVLLTPVHQKMDIDETPDDSNPKKKDTPQIDKFTVPMSQIQTITPSKPLENKLKPRRVQLVPSNQSANAAAGPKPVSGQTVAPRRVQLVTTSQADPALASIQSVINNVQSANVVPLGQTSQGAGQIVMSGQTAQAQPRRVQLVTAMPSQVPRGSNNSVPTVNSGNIQPVQGNVAGQTVQAQPRRVQLATIVPENTAKALPTQVQLVTVPQGQKTVVPVQTVQAQPRRVQLMTVPAGQTAQVLPTQVQLVTVPQGQTSADCGQTSANHGQTAQGQPRQVQLVTIPSGQTPVDEKTPVDGQIPQVQSTMQSVTPLPGQTSVSSGQTSQTRRVQLVAVPPEQTTISSEQTLNNTQKTGQSPSTQATLSKLGQTTSKQVGTTPASTIPVAMTTAQKGSQGAQPTIVQTVLRRVQLETIASKLKEVSVEATGSGLNGQNPSKAKQDGPLVSNNQNKNLVKPVQRRIEISSLLTSNKQDDRTGQPSVKKDKKIGKVNENGTEVKERKRRIPLTSVSAATTANNSNPTKENAARKPIPLEPTVIVID